MRKIIHIDADCFFAAVEMRDNPLLRDVPMAVGGPSDSRGVLCTANYLAREYGVRSAMSSAQAVRLCPHLVIVSGHMEKYRAVSEQMREIFKEYTDLIEPLSLDEAYLDVTESTRCYGSATLMAAEMREKIASITGITVSAGVACNKFLAKIASDWNKPNGQFVVSPSVQETFVRGIPVGQIWGVGQVAQAKMAALGIQTCGDLQQVPMLDLMKHFGRFAYTLSQLAQGIDTRPVVGSRIRKSISVEHTFEQDLMGVEACLEQLPLLFSALNKRVQKEYAHRRSKAFVKIKFDNFQQTTMEEALLSVHSWHQFRHLTVQAIARQNRPIRLMGLGYRLKEIDPKQLDFDFPASTT